MDCKSKARKHIEKQRYYFAYKGPYSQSYSFSNSHVQMWELDNNEGWALKNWCFWTVCWRFLRVPLDTKEIKPVNPKGNQLWIFIGRTDVRQKLQYCGHLIRGASLLEKTLRLENVESRRRRWSRMKWSDGITNLMDMSSSKLREMVKNKEAWCAVGRAVTKLDVTEWLNSNIFTDKDTETIWRSHRIW